MITKGRILPSFLPSMFLRLNLFLQLLLSGSLAVHAQRIDHVPGELIVALASDDGFGQWRKNHPAFITVRPLIRETNLYLATFDHDAVPEADILQALQADPAVYLVQYNHPVTARRRPADPRYDELWQYRNVGQLDGRPGDDFALEDAWNTTTGGVTINGDTIVVAVLDDGTDLDHEDLVANLWRNHDEIPGNGIDDDENGYVDDYFGFDTENDDGNPDASTAHGTPVAGIIGAVGDNDLGVTGVNWKVKLMTIRNGFLSSEAEVLQAYGYALNARQRYNDTGGREGAYVVVTNASWGRNYGNVADSPIWCDLFDRLGAVGILNAGAAANLNIDVDELGDLPTNCPSDFLIGVTSLGTRSERVSNAAFGSASVDLGAYGQDILTTDLGNGYAPVGGTSFATPHVAGAAALLYSAPCAAFGELLRSDPAAAARYVRRALLESVRPNPDLKDKTTTEGQLDIGAAMASLMEDCGDCFAPTSFEVSPVGGSSSTLRISYQSIVSITQTTLRYRRAGAEVWTELENPSLPLVLEGLAACTAYEFELAASCGAVGTATQSVTVNTDGCCIIPDDFRVRAAPGLQFLASWSEQLAGRSYRIRFRKVGATSWTTRTSTGGVFGIGGGISPCTPYEFEFSTDCDTTNTGFGKRKTVVSTGCGACLEATYCSPPGYDNSTDWIEEVNIGNILVNRTAREVRGFGDFSGAEGMTVVRGGAYPMVLTPGRLSSNDIQDFRVYADWNHDGFFSSREIVGEGDSRRGRPAEIDMVVPDDAPELSTRVRVLMNFLIVRGSACSGPAQGEYEDYCIDVVAAGGCPAPSALFADFAENDETTRLRWRASRAPGGSYRLRYRPSGSGEDWTENDVTGVSLEVDKLNLCRAYDVQLASVCGGSPGAYRTFRFSDNCTDTRRPSLPDADWWLSPNPATTFARVDLAPALGAGTIRLYSAEGRLLSTQRTDGGMTTLVLSSVVAGVYLVELRLTDGRRGVRKLLVR